MIHGVVVNERRNVHELHHGGQRHGVRGGLVPHVAGQQQERWPKELAGHIEEIVIDLLDHREIRNRDPAQLFEHEFEPVSYRRLYPGKPLGRSPGSRGCLRHVRG